MVDDPVRELVGPRVLLRVPCPADIDVRLRLGIHPEIQWGYGLVIDEWRPLTRDEAERWYARLGVSPDAVSWVVEVGGALVGEAHLHTWVRAERRAMFAVGLLHPRHLGRGLGSEIVRLVLDHAFGTLDLHRVALRVLARNSRAIASYERAGFRIEGRERETAHVDGSWEDDLIMGILRHEHEAIRARAQ